MAKITMRQIARQAGVSATTVSHVLNHTKGAQVAQRTRQKVLSVARKLGYQRSLLARSVKSRLRHLGVAVGGGEGVEDPYTAAIFDGVRERALSLDYFPVVQPMPVREGRVKGLKAARRMIGLYQSKLVDGFVIDKQSFVDALVRRLADEGVPLVMVNGSQATTTSAGEHVPSVVVDNAKGGLLATEHLLGLGHRRIGLVTLPYARYARRHRPFQVARLIRGYRAALEEAGIEHDPELVTDGDPPDRLGTARAVGRLLELSTPPTAVFVGDDAMAVMAIHALARRGLRVPRDVSVVGYGDWTPAVQLAEPELTTVSIPLKENGRRAAEALVHLIEKGRLEEPRTCLSPELVVRASSAAPRRARDGAMSLSKGAARKRQSGKS